MVSSTSRPRFTPGKDPVPILQEAGWAPGSVWTGGKSRPHRESIPDSPARSSVAILTELPGPHTVDIVKNKQCAFMILRCVQCDMIIECGSEAKCCYVWSTIRTTGSIDPPTRIQGVCLSGCPIQQRGADRSSLELGRGLKVPHDLVTKGFSGALLINQ